MITLENNDTSYELDFEFANAKGIWVKTDVKCSEALETIKTGLLRNLPVSKIMLFAITDTVSSNSFVYDIEAAKTGSPNVWSIVQVDL